MKKILVILFLVTGFTDCSDNKKAPDVSGIKVDIKVERFEKDFFKIDSNNLSTGLTQLKGKYLGFYNDYMQGILGVSGADTDSSTKQMTRIMLSNYKPIYDAAESGLSAFSDLEEDLKNAFQFVKYYFPEYKTPGIITFVGTLDAPGTILTDKYIGIGLHQYAGKDFEGYQLQGVKELYPSYISRRFEPEYIPANCMKAVVSDLFPDKSNTKPLVEQMIEKGKQWWLLDKFMPGVPDSIKTGYTQYQLDWCKQNEGLIWSYIIKNNELRSVNPVTIQTYIGEGPFTKGLSQEDSPGNIGTWIGWQIVKKYEEKNPGMKPGDIMMTNAEQILNEGKYKPK